MSTTSILQIKNLGINFTVPSGVIRAIDGVTMDVPKGKITAIIGESGCGKSTIANAILGMFSGNAIIDTGSEILFEGKNLLALTPGELRMFRWQKASMVFQSAQSAMNPTLPIQEQLIDTILDHDPKATRTSALARATERLKLVQLDSERVLKAYPHQISGGMRQRVIIAMAMLLEPQFIILDEPTTALDVITQHLIFTILSEIHARSHISLILITHDIELAARFSDNIVVLYGGELFETLPSQQMQTKPGHPYTQGLYQSIPRISGADVAIKPIPGHPPDLIKKPTGCIFRPRCTEARERCEKEKPGLLVMGDQWLAACHFAKERVHETLPQRSGGEGVNQ